MSVEIIRNHIEHNADFVRCLLSNITNDWMWLLLFVVRECLWLCLQLATDTHTIINVLQHGKLVCVFIEWMFIMCIGISIQPKAIQFGWWLKIVWQWNWFSDWLPIVCLYVIRFSWSLVQTIERWQAYFNGIYMIMPQFGKSNCCWSIYGRMRHHNIRHIYLLIHHNLFISSGFLCQKWLLPHIFHLDKWQNALRIVE